MHESQMPIVTEIEHLGQQPPLLRLRRLQKDHPQKARSLFIALARAAPVGHSMMGTRRRGGRRRRRRRRREVVVGDGGVHGTAGRGDLARLGGAREDGAPLLRAARRRLEGVCSSIGTTARGGVFFRRVEHRGVWQRFCPVGHGFVLVHFPF